MGLLSPLGLLQAAAFQRPQFMGPVIPAPAPQQQQRRPFQPVPQITAPPIADPAMMQQAPQPYTAPNVRPPGFGERLENWTQSPLFNIGMSLLGNASSPDQWAGVGRDVRTFGADQRERQRQENEERRLAAQERMQGQVFGRQQTDWRLADQQQAAFEEAVRNAPPEQQATLRALGRQGYGDYLQREDNQAFEAEQNRLGREAQLRAANIAAANRRDPRDSIQYRSDMSRLSDMSTAANFANLSVLPRLRRAREIVGRLSQIGGMDNPLSADRRIQLSQLGQFGEEARGLLQELRRIQTQFTVEDARALAPVSNTDFGRLMDINLNGNMTVDSFYSILSGMEQDVTRGVNNYNAAVQWADRYNGLTGTLDPQGRTFEQSQYQAMSNAPSPQQSPGQQPATAPQTMRTNTLPSPRGLQEGTRAHDSQTNRDFVIRNGQWALVPSLTNRTGRPVPSSLTRRD